MDKDSKFIRLKIIRFEEMLCFVKMKVLKKGEFLSLTFLSEFSFALVFNYVDTSTILIFLP